MRLQPSNSRLVGSSQLRQALADSPSLGPNRETCVMASWVPFHGVRWGVACPSQAWSGDPDGPPSGGLTGSQDWAGVAQGPTQSAWEGGWT